MLPVVLLLAHSTSTVAAAALADWRIGAGDDGLIPCSALTLPVAVATDATADSQAAAAELAQWLGRITNSSVQVTQPAAISAGVPHFAVGPAAAMAAPGITSAELVALGPESFVVRGSWGGVIALSGAPDANRGTQFAVLQLLHAIGVRFLAADATVVPSCCQHCVQATPRKLINISWVPAFNFRAVDGWASNHDPTHAMRSHLDVNPEAPFASPPGFVHTSYRLFPSETPPFNCSSYIRCPSESFFREHREWFWPHNDSSAYGQLCWHNQSLIKYLIGTVKGFLRDSRNMNATLIDVSQNDNGNYCKDPEELAIIAEEQSGVGPILRAVNAIADAIREEFPRVSVSTLAYDYGEQPPIKTQVRENVAIRLCTGSMNFAQPITHDSNARFRTIVEGWRHKANATRLRIWDYVVDSANPLQIFPNYLNLAPNIQYWAQLGVTQLYLEGPGLGDPAEAPTGPGPGTDMEELKDYVMSTMMWDPSANASEVLDEFLRGYYGDKVAPHLRAFVERMQEVARASGPLASNTGMPTVWRTAGPGFLNASNFGTLLQANADFVSAFAAAEEQDLGPKPEINSRLRRAYQAVLLPSLWRWDELRAFATQHTVAWPLPATKATAFEDFARTYNETETRGIVYNNYYSIPKQCVYGCALKWLHECILSKTCPGNGHVGSTTPAQLQPK